MATIYGHVREMIPPDGWLIVIEPILPEAVEGSLPPPAAFSVIEARPV